MIVYTAGPYQSILNKDGKTIISKKHNLKVARNIAIDLWDEGYTVICPHLNTKDFEFYTCLTNEGFVTSDLEIVSLVDALVMLPNWYLSNGAVRERGHALESGVRVVVWPELP